MKADPAALVRLGEVCGVHGIKGWVKVRSYTEPRSNLTAYRDWLLDSGGRQTPVQVEDASIAGRNVIAKLAGVDDRDAALALVGAAVLVPRTELPQCAPGEYYWADLEGLEVASVDGMSYGRVDHLLRTGSNDVLVVRGERERLIPFVADDVVKSVDLDAGRIVVDWDPAF